MNIHFKKAHISFLFNLLNIPLHGQERRDRDAFLNILIEKGSELDKQRINLVKMYAEKDEKGEPKIDETKNYVIAEENRRIVDKEYYEIVMEDAIIDVLDSNKNVIRSVKNLLEKTNKPLTFDESKILTEILDGFDFNKPEETFKEEKTQEQEQVVEDKTN